MHIRSYDAADEQTLIALWRDCNLVVPWNDPAKDIQRKLQVDPELLLVGEVAGELIASVMAGYEGHRGWVNYLAVAPAHRGKGYARALMAEVELRLRSRGCPKVNLQIRSGNTAVRGFYESLGYRFDESICLGKRLEQDN